MSDSAHYGALIGRQRTAQTTRHIQVYRAEPKRDLE